MSQLTLFSIIAEERRHQTPPIVIKERYERIAITNRPEFDYAAKLHYIMNDIVTTLPEFAHINMERVYVATKKTRKRSNYGMQANIQALRFQDGSPYCSKKGYTWYWPDVYLNDKQLYYIINVFLPRFHNHSFHYKIQTLIHELYHISPFCNGDIRTFGKKRSAHGHSKKKFHLHMSEITDRYLSTVTDMTHFQFLRNSFQYLKRKYSLVLRNVRGMRPVLIKQPAVYTQ